MREELQNSPPPQDDPPDLSRFSTAELVAMRDELNGGPPKPETGTDLIEAGADVAMNFGKGSNALLKMAGDFYGLATGNMDNALRDYGEHGIEYFQERLSDEFKASDATRRQAIDGADDELGKAWAYVRETVKDPRLLSAALAEQAPNLVALGAGGKIAQGGAKVLLKKLTTQTAEQVAKRSAQVGVASAVGAGAGMQGSDVGGDVYQQMIDELEAMPEKEARAIPQIKTLLDQGADLDEAKLALALTAARKTGAGAAAISVGSQLIPGGRSIEKALVGGPAAGKARGLLARMAIGGAGEGAQEMLEEGGGKVAANAALRTVDPERKLSEGLGETIGQAGLVAMLPGGASGLANGAGNVRDRSKLQKLNEQMAEDLARLDAEREAVFGAGPDPTENAASSTDPEASPITEEWGDLAPDSALPEVETVAPTLGQPAPEVETGPAPVAADLIPVETQPLEAQASEVTEQSGEQPIPETIVKTKRKGRSFRLGSREDGVTDLLDQIQDNGGIAGPSTVKDPGGEYDGFKETFGAGPARVLVRKGGSKVDQLIADLNESGEFQFETTDDFYNAVARAVEERQTVRENVKAEIDQGKFETAIYDNEGRRKADAPVRSVNSDTLNVGTTFRVKGEPFTVTDIDPDTGALIIRDGPRYGTQSVPADTPIYPDKKTLRREKQTAPTEDVPFARRTPEQRQAHRAALEAKRAEWKAKLEQIAPGLIGRFGLKFGNPEQLIRRGKLDTRTLTGYEQAAYDATERMLYLFDQSLQASTDAPTMLNLVHELGHAHYDTLTPSRQAELLTIWRREVGEKSGPLYTGKGLRTGVAEGVESSVKEWYAERLAWANRGWAIAHSGAGQGIFGRLSQQFRQLLAQLQGWIQEARGESINVDFRQFLTTPAPLEAKSGSGPVQTRRAKLTPDAQTDIFSDGALAGGTAIDAEGFMDERELVLDAKKKQEQAQGGFDFARRRTEPGLSISERLAGAKDAFKHWIVRNFTSAGGMPIEAFRAKVAREGRLASISKQMEFALKDLDLAIHGVYGGYAEMTEAQLEQLNEVLGGRQPLESLDARIQRPLGTMRSQIDAMSSRLIKEGAIEGTMAAKIDGNIGFYLNRSYRKFDDPKWAKKVPQEIRNRAATTIRAQLRNKLVQDLADAEYLRLGKPRGSELLAGAQPEQQGELIEGEQAEPQINFQDRKRAEYQLVRDEIAGRDDVQVPEEQVQGMIEYLLGKDVTGPGQLFSAPNSGQKDLRVLTKRKQIPPEIRALLGEYKDPRVNYLRSVGKTAQIVESHAYLVKLRELGLGDWLHDRPISNATGNYTVPLAGEGSDAWAPLNGLYTTPEIAAALKSQLAATDPAWAWWLRLNGWAKTAKTVFSPMTQTRNLAGNLGFLVANGHWRGHKVAEVWRAMRTELFNDRKGRAYVAKLSRLGILGESVSAGELKEALGDAGMKLQGFEEWTEHRLTRAAKSPFKLAARLYRLNDEIFKVYAFENERAAWASAEPGLTAEQLDTIAAERVRNTLPTYSLIPNAAQKVRRVALTGSFLSFPAEVVRTTWHALNYMQQDLRSANPRIKAMGAKRAAGLITVATLPAAISMMSKWLTGMDDDEERKLRRFLPEWNRNADLYHLGNDGKGAYKMIDASYLDPWNYLKKPLTAMLNGENWEQGITEAMLEASAPFAGEGILTKSIFDLARNQDARGYQIFNPELPFIDRSIEQLNHVWRTFEPGFINQGRRIVKAAKGEKSDSGRLYDLKGEVGAVLTGARAQSLDAHQGYLSKAKEFSARKSAIEQIYLRVKHNRGEVTPEQKEAARETMETARRELYRIGSLDSQAARGLGVSQGEIAIAQLGAGLSKLDVALLISGQYIPYFDRPDSRNRILQNMIRGK